jgi:hypothetical protein
MKKDSLAAPTKAHLTASIKACISNGDRLLADGMTLEFEKPAATKLFLAMIAQEEFAKAFLLFMVYEDVLPWSKSLLRTMNDHSCMFPPRGMCRVWFTKRAPANQPAIESCNGIKSRVPAGAYVIYGG